MTSQARPEENGFTAGIIIARPPSEPNPLTQVGPGTAGGEYMRRYWHPIILASEVKELPKALRILGEDLVIFRDRSNTIGLLHKHCIHRGASLEFGIPQEHGIMCCYHGWHFDTNGKILGCRRRARDKPHSDEFWSGRLSGAGGVRPDLHLYGPAGADAGIPVLRYVYASG